MTTPKTPKKRLEDLESKQDPEPIYIVVNWQMPGEESDPNELIDVYGPNHKKIQITRAEWEATNPLEIYFDDIEGEDQDSDKSSTP